MGSGKRWWAWQWVVVAFAGLVVVAVCAVLVPWSDLDDVGSWDASDRFAALGIVFGIVFGFVFTVAEIVGPSWWEERRSRQGVRVPDITPQLREDWRAALADRVLALRQRQLDRLATIGPQITLDAYATTELHPGAGTAASRVRLAGGTVHLDDLPALWDHGKRRVVLLGEAGSGKSHAALSLVTAVTRHAVVSSGPVADVFLLADWYVWHLDHRNSALEDWLVEQLSEVHAIPSVIAENLLATGLVVPVLDGLDEVPTGKARATCKERIDAYSGKATHRPLFVTCRFEEYRELAPEWVAADDTLTIRPLSPAQIASTISATSPRHPGWDAIVEHLHEPGSHIARVLSTPLLLTTALAAYVEVDPRELMDVPEGDAWDRVWDRFFTPTQAVAYRDHGLDDIQRWLVWLATRMQATGRQAFSLHELSFVVPERDRRLRRFRLFSGLAVGLAVGLVFVLVGGLTGELTGELAVGLGFGLFVGLFVGRGVSDQVSRSEGVSLSARLDRVRRQWKSGVVVGLLVGLVVGLIGGLVGGLVGGLIFGLASVLFGVLVDVLSGGRSFYTPERSDHYESGDPTSAIRASARAALPDVLAIGLAGGLSFGLAGGLVAGLAVGLVFGLVGLFVGLVVGLLGFGLRGGLDAAIYYWWLTRRLAANGLFPSRPDRFLQWCAGTRDTNQAEGTTTLTRRWVRQAGGTFQFRHRDFQEHLARHGGWTPPPPDTVPEPATDGT